MDFSKAYNRQEFISFLQNNFLPDDFIPTIEDVQFPTQTKYAQTATKLGECSSLELSVYEVRHVSKHDARVGLSREAFRMLAQEFESRAIIVFVPQDTNANYRLSFIEITLLGLEGTKIKRAYSNPRRYSYYLGEGIAVYTPNKYLNEKGRVTSEEDLRSRFSVEVLTKDFYNELSDWYAWAINIIHFPNNIATDKDNQKYNQEGVIRLITRLIFVWFLKQRGLVPWQFFDEQYIHEYLLEDFNPHVDKDLFFKSKDSTYYRAILQNLFFAMLNCPITREGSSELTERRFKDGRNGYDDNKLMRYRTLFKDPDLFLRLANENVPFLNGGLFDCLDDKQNGLYYDGFSERKEAQVKLCVPDYLFFGDEVGKCLDLSVFYGDKKKKKVSARGIIDILKRYNFTVEENMPFDKDVSLDPELLGKVFENLLAAYNPETQSTARKQTGSFYTPREIVQYMVDESLVAHLKRTVGEELEPEYRKLLSFSDDEISLTGEQKQLIMQSLYQCKILDPACGSGAFPVGILQQMVHVLTKLDPDNSRWKDLLMERAISETSEAYRTASDDERKEMVSDIERSFDESVNRPDYARKLYLIENCIFGVDIQPIAIQISKLRFFITLVADQKINHNPADNFGIRPLPNLEAKFVAANTLIGLKRKEADIFESADIKAKEGQMKTARHKIFSARTFRTKQKYRALLTSLRQEIADLLIENNYVDNEQARELASWDMFNQNASSPFFDPEWMFGVKNGFDIVIANPPYINANELKKHLGKENYEKLKSLYLTAKGTVDFYVYFFERGLNLLMRDGILSYITPNKYLSANYGKALRKFILDNVQIYELVDVSREMIFDASVYPIITFLKQESNQVYSFKTIDKDKKSHIFLSSQLSTFPENIWGFLLSSKYDLTERLVNVSLPILKVCKINATSTAAEADKFHSYIRDGGSGFLLINTGTIDPFITFWGFKHLIDKGCKYLHPILPKDETILGTYRYEMYNMSKIIVAKMSYVLEGFYDEKGEYASINTNCFHSIKTNELAFLGWIHSKLFNYIYECYFESLKMSGGYLPFTAPYLSCMCVPRELDDDKLVDIVKEILESSKINSNLDLFFYKLYGLTYDEVLTVDPKTPITEEEYNKD